MLRESEGIQQSQTPAFTGSPAFAGDDDPIRNCAGRPSGPNWPHFVSEKSVGVLPVTRIVSCSRRDIRTANSALRLSPALLALKPRCMLFRPCVCR